MELPRPMSPPSIGPTVPPVTPPGRATGKPLVSYESLIGRPAVATAVDPGAAIPNGTTTTGSAGDGYVVRLTGGGTPFIDTSGPSDPLVSVAANAMGTAATALSKSSAILAAMRAAGIILP